MDLGPRTLKKQVVTSVKNEINISKRNPLISEECVNTLNYRIEQEEYSSRIYLAMSMWLDDNGYVNASKLWRKYSSEEQSHADWAREYLLAMGVQPLTPALELPQQSFSGLPEIIRMSFQHEIDITNQIKSFADSLVGYNDHMLYELTLKYLKEQVEESGKLQSWIDQLNAFGEDKIALRLLDNAMSE